MSRTSKYKIGDIPSTLFKKPPKKGFTKADAKIIGGILWFIAARKKSKKRKEANLAAQRTAQRAEEHHRQYLWTQYNNSSQGLQSMSGHDFEHYCADLLRHVGYTNVKVTKGSGDNGMDIYAVRDGASYCIQVKYYNSAVGNSAVQEAFAGKNYHQCTYSVVLTNSTFTKSAIETARRLNVGLWGGDILAWMAQVRANKLGLELSSQVQAFQPQPQRPVPGAEPKQMRPTANVVFVHQDQCVAVAFLGCIVLDSEQTAIFRVQNLTKVELRFDCNSLAFDGKGIRGAFGYDDIAPLSTGELHVTADTPFPSMTPQSISGKINVSDDSETVIKDYSYGFAFADVPITYLST